MEFGQFCIKTNDIVFKSKCLKKDLIKKSLNINKFLILNLRVQLALKSSVLLTVESLNVFDRYHLTSLRRFIFIEIAYLPSCSHKCFIILLVLYLYDYNKILIHNNINYHLWKFSSHSVIVASLIVGVLQGEVLGPRSTCSRGADIIRHHRYVFRSIAFEINIHIYHHARFLVG